MESKYSKEFCFIDQKDFLKDSKNLIDSKIDFVFAIEQITSRIRLFRDVDGFAPTGSRKYSNGIYFAGHIDEQRKPHFVNVKNISFLIAVQFIVNQIVYFENEFKEVYEYEKVKQLRSFDRYSRRSALPAFHKKDWKALIDLQVYYLSYTFGYGGDFNIKQNGSLVCALNKLSIWRPFCPVKPWDEEDPDLHEKVKLKLVFVEDQLEVNLDIPERAPRRSERLRLRSNRKI